MTTITGLRRESATHRAYYLLLDCGNYPCSWEELAQEIRNDYLIRDLDVMRAILTRATYKAAGELEANYWETPAEERPTEAPCHFQLVRNLKAIERLS